MSQFANVKFWDDSELLECVTRTPEAPNVVTFSFRSPSGALFNHDPGQFITVELPVPGGPVYRTYTISSSPSRPTALTLTVKAQEDSIGGRWMIDNLHKGMKIKAVGPAGGFSIVNHPAKKYLFISAGSGITPMVAMTTWLYDSGEEPDIVFVNCARRPSELILRQRMELMASRIVGIDLKWVVDGSDPFHPWTGYRGFLNQVMLGLMAHDYLDREVFCCGPEPFMRVVRGALEGPADASLAVAVTQPTDALLEVTVTLEDDVLVDAASRKPEAVDAADHVSIWIGMHVVRLARDEAGWFSSAGQIASSAPRRVVVRLPVAWSSWVADPLELEGWWAPIEQASGAPERLNDQAWRGSLVVAFADVDSPGGERTVVSTAPIPKKGEPHGILVKLPRASRWPAATPDLGPL